MGGGVVVEVVEVVEVVGAGKVGSCDKRGRGGGGNLVFSWFFPFFISMFLIRCYFVFRPLRLRASLFPLWLYRAQMLISAIAFFLTPSTP